MTCPFLDYRDSAGDRAFDTARAYCTAVDRFVQPMRADVCNDRYDLDHASDCEIFLAHEDELDEAELEEAELDEDETGGEEPTEGSDA